MEDYCITEAMMAVADYAQSMDMVPVNKVEGCWENQVNEQWWIAVNGHQENKLCSKNIDVPPFTCYVEFNGWPAGYINPYGGVLAAGTAANEETFVAALKAQTREEHQSF